MRVEAGHLGRTKSALHLRCAQVQISTDVPTLYKCSLTVPYARRSTLSYRTRTHTQQALTLAEASVLKWHISSAPTPPSACSARAYKRTRVTRALHVRTDCFVSETTHKHTFAAEHTPERQTRGSPCRRLQPLPPPEVRECADEQGRGGRLCTSTLRPSHWRNDLTRKTPIMGLCTCKPLMASSAIGPATRQPLASSS